jgi:hypothetical protein
METTDIADINNTSGEPNTTPITINRITELSLLVHPPTSAVSIQLHQSTSFPK